MRRVSLLAIVVSILTINGCGTGKIATKTGPQAPIKSYSIGDTLRTTTGSELLKLYAGQELPAYKPVFDKYTPPKPPNSSEDPPEFSSNDRWVVVAEKYGNDNLLDELIIIKRSYWEVFFKVASVDAISINPDGTIKRGWVSEDVYTTAMTTNQSIGQYPRATSFSSASLEQEWPKVKMFAKAGRVSVPLNFSAELIYSGKSGDTINLLYREYYDNTARPAFSQNLQYDLGESNTISYKSLEIKIMEAQNSSITYRVVEDGGLPWMPKK